MKKLSPSPQRHAVPLETSGDDEAAFAASLRAQVLAGLLQTGQKELPAAFLYDELGSTLFDVITLLPEYGLTRAGARLLARYAGPTAAKLHPPVRVIELGSGSGKLAAPLLEAIAARQGTVPYLPIDISGGALARCRQELERIAGVSVQPVHATFAHGLSAALADRAKNDAVLVLFLGSTIGNFARTEAEQFLRYLRGVLTSGDTLLLATDLEQREAKLLPAYADALGVTAAFNLNLLRRANRELGADFVLSRYLHHARYDERHRRVEMHLRARVRHEVTLSATRGTIALGAGETIWTESSNKFDRDEVAAMCEQTGFALLGQWVDDDWPLAHTLLVAA